MWKKYMVMLGGAVLVVSLPMAAQAVTAEEEDAGIHNAYTAEEARFINQGQDRIREIDSAPLADQMQTRSEAAVREQLRVHVDADPPADVDPLQKRLQERTRLATGSGDTPMGDIGAHRGNPDAPMLGDGTGDCVMEGEPEVDGPYGPKSPNKG